MLRRELHFIRDSRARVLRWDGRLNACSTSLRGPTQFLLERAESSLTGRPGAGSSRSRGA